jgi:hypothetical protein
VANKQMEVSLMGGLVKLKPIVADFANCLKADFVYFKILRAKLAMNINAIPKSIIIIVSDIWIYHLIKFLKYYYLTATK